MLAVVNRLALRIWCATPSQRRPVRLMMHAIRLRSFSLALWVMEFEDAEEAAL